MIRHIEGNRFPLGEIDGADTERVRRLAQLFRDAGFKTPVMSDIRSEIWLKLWGNLSFNPISALTHATLEDICRFPETRALVATMMAEAQAIGEKLGVAFKVSIDKRIAGAEAVGAHKTSMLQDVEAGRALELDALVRSVIELGQITRDADAGDRACPCAGRAARAQPGATARAAAHRHPVSARPPFGPLAQSTQSRAFRPAQ